MEVNLDETTQDIADAKYVLVLAKKIMKNLFQRMKMINS